MRGKLVWDTYTCVISKAGLAKEVVVHEGGLSKGVLLYCMCAHLIMHTIHVHELGIVCNCIQLSGILTYSSF